MKKWCCYGYHNKAILARLNSGIKIRICKAHLVCLCNFINPSFPDFFSKNFWEKKERKKERRKKRETCKFRLLLWPPDNSKDGHWPSIVYCNHHTSTHNFLLNESLAVKKTGEWFNPSCTVVLLLRKVNLHFCWNFLNWSHVKCSSFF